MEIPQGYITDKSDLPIREPHKCPVCEGRGAVWAGLYTPTFPLTHENPCRACDATGVVWGRRIA